MKAITWRNVAVRDVRHSASDRAFERRMNEHLVELSKCIHVQVNALVEEFIATRKREENGVV